MAGLPQAAERAAGLCGPCKEYKTILQYTRGIIPGEELFHPLQERIALAILILLK